MVFFSQNLIVVIKDKVHDGGSSWANIWFINTQCI